MPPAEPHLLARGPHSSTHGYGGTWHCKGLACSSARPPCLSTCLVLPVPFQHLSHFFPCLCGCVPTSCATVRRFLLPPWIFWVHSGLFLLPACNHWLLAKLWYWHCPGLQNFLPMMRPHIRLPGPPARPFRGPTLVSPRATIAQIHSPTTSTP